MSEEKFIAYKMKVSLEGNRRGVNRTIRIAGDRTFDDLNALINHALDFDNDHLYSFSFNRKELYSDNSYQLLIKEDFWAKPNSSNTPLKDVIGHEKQKMYYVFDFGDSWHFEILIQKIEEVDEIIKSEVLKSVGVVNQYPEWDKDEDYNTFVEDEEWDED
ncbi:MAG: plasmid pRiA4b ORF-3 family protein [Methanobrevibacter sp.]|jgi:hypothetical protein|nr:plasmid pRiA4b ORF-3 family protein [Methanobrevibacter sp.]